MHAEQVNNMLWTLTFARDCELGTQFASQHVLRFFSSRGGRNEAPPEIFDALLLSKFLVFF